MQFDHDPTYDHRSREFRLKTPRFLQPTHPVLYEHERPLGEVGEEAVHLALDRHDGEVAAEEEQHQDPMLDVSAVLK